MIGHQAEYLFNDIIAVSVLGVVRGRLGSFEQFVSNNRFSYSIRSLAILRHHVVPDKQAHIEVYFCIFFYYVLLIRFFIEIAGGAII